MTRFNRALDDLPSFLNFLCSSFLILPPPPPLSFSPVHLFRQPLSSCSSLSSPTLLFLSVLVDDVFKKCDQRPLAALVPTLHEAAIAFAGQQGIPVEPNSLLADLLLLLPLAHITSVPSRLPSQTLVLLPHLIEDSNWTPLPARWLPPAEVLYCVGGHSGTRSGGGGERAGA